MKATARTFLGALARDVRGNTLAIMAAALIPLAGLVGGGIDISRMYITKTRLQHACDAGALAGRKAMGGGVWTQSNSLPNTTANQFFDANFQNNTDHTGAYGSTGVARSYSENAGKVTGTAQATLPMTLMRVLGKTTETLAVTCDAEMRLPNTDVMFVLDNSGSMGDKAVSTDSDTKIESLRTSVKCFYEIVARLDTDANCTTGNPGTSGTGNQVQIRFGFVNYSTNVNVGKLLPPSYFPDSWTYQTREPQYTTSNQQTWVQQGNPTVTTNSVSQTGVPQSSCNDAAAAAAGYNSNTDAYSNNNTIKTNTTVNTHVTNWSSSNGGTCTGTQTKTITVYKLQTIPSQTFSQWHYGAISVPLTALKNGNGWNDSLTLPIGTNGAAKTVAWDGCIEERHTVPGTDFTPIPSGANDLDIDSVPVAGNTDTMWKPALPGLIYMRKNGSSYTRNDVYTTSNYSQPSADCPTESRKLQAWTNATDFDSYVDSLVPTVNTYHDIGLLWGARFLSPTGIFASENALTPQGGEIERHLIFMTDGDTQTSTSDYAAYGLPWYDLRNIRSSDIGNTPGNDDMNDEVNARFLALCTAIKNQNITLWVISFGSGSNSTTENRLSNCATSGRFFTARNSATLQSTFASIADQISQLRLTK